MLPLLSVVHAWQPGGPRSARLQRQAQLGEPPVRTTAELERKLGALVVDEEGEVVGRERAVRMFVTSVAAMQPKAAPSTVPPSDLLPQELLPASLMGQQTWLSQARKRLGKAAEKLPSTTTVWLSTLSARATWLAMAGAFVIAAATLWPLPSGAADAAVEQPPAVAAEQQLQQPAAEAEQPPPPQKEEAGVVGLSRAQVETRLSKIPVTAIVNKQGSPFMVDSERSLSVGYFYLDPKDALLDFQVLKQGGATDASLTVVPLSDVYFPYIANANEKELGGSLRLRPARKEIVLANRAIQFNGGGSSKNLFGLPTTLDERKGQVPVFYSEKVVLEDAEGAKTYPFFLAKDDLDAAWREFGVGRPAGGGSGAVAAKPEVGGFAAQAFGGGGDGGGDPRSTSKQREAQQAEGLPYGLVRVATLDGMVEQMQRGDVDLRGAVIVGSREALIATQKLATSS